MAADRTAAYHPEPWVRYVELSLWTVALVLIVVAGILVSGWAALVAFACYVLGALTREFELIRRGRLTP